MLETVLKNLRWLGHDGFILKAAGKTIVFDPYGVSGPEKADIILISHEHFDHCSPEDVAKFAGPDTVIITEPLSAAKLEGGARTMKPGDTIKVHGVTVTAAPAYNMGKPFHPKSSQWLGFLVTVDGVTVYHAGDTDLIPEMADVRCDIALLPVSGTYVMTWEEAVEAARRIKPVVAVPMHYGGIVGTKEDAEKFAEALKGEIRVEFPAGSF